MKNRGTCEICDLARIRYGPSMSVLTISQVRTDRGQSDLRTWRSGLTTSGLDGSRTDRGRRTSDSTDRGLKRVPLTQTINLDINNMFNSRSILSIYSLTASADLCLMVWIDSLRAEYARFIDHALAVEVECTGGLLTAT